MKQAYQKPKLTVTELTASDVITASGSAPVTPPTEAATLPNKDNEYGFDDLF